MKEVEFPFPQDSLEQSVSSSGQELKAEEEIALRDWNDDSSHWEMFSPKRKRLYVVEWILYRELIYCDYPIECDEGEERDMELWSIIPANEAYSPNKSIYLGVTSWDRITTEMPVENAYSITDFWGFNLREIAEKGEEYRFLVSYNTPESWEWRSYNSQVDDWKIIGKK